MNKMKPNKTKVSFNLIIFIQCLKIIIIPNYRRKVITNLRGNWKNNWKRQKITRRNLKTHTIRLKKWLRFNKKIRRTIKKFRG